MNKECGKYVGCRQEKCGFCPGFTPLPHEIPELVENLNCPIIVYGTKFSYKKCKLLIYFFQIAYKTVSVINYL